MLTWLLKDRCTLSCCTGGPCSLRIQPERPSGGADGPRAGPDGGGNGAFLLLFQSPGYGSGATRWGTVSGLSGQEGSSVHTKRLLPCENAGPELPGVLLFFVFKRS